MQTIILRSIASLLTAAVVFTPISAQTTDVDVTAEITALYGGSASPTIMIFGQSTSIGSPVSANLDVVESAGVLPFSDPLPARSYCIGPRNQDKSVISRRSFGTGATVLIDVEIVGGTGFMPGSAGYIQLTNPHWMIDRVVSTGQAPPGLDGFPGPSVQDSSGNVGRGFGLRVDRVAGRIEWCGGGSCQACACPENEVNFVAIVKVRDPAQPLLSLELPHSVACSDNDTVNVGATFEAGNAAGTFFLTLETSYANTSLVQRFVTFHAAPNQMLHSPSILLVSVAGLPPGDIPIKWSLFDMQSLRHVLEGTERIQLTSGPTSSCP